MVAGALLLASAILVVAILANRDLKDTIGHAQASLRTAQAAAEDIRADTGSFLAADASGLEASAPSLVLLGPDDPSRGLDELSISASQTDWAAAVQARPGACFYVRLDLAGQEFFGTGAICTARQALSAAEPRW